MKKKKDYDVKHIKGKMRNCWFGYKVCKRPTWTCEECKNDLQDFEDFENRP